MKIPLKPIKPREPVPPKEFYEVKNKIYIDESTYSIKDLLKLNESATVDNLIFDGVYYCGNDYGDDSGYGLTPYVLSYEQNKKYESQKKKYDKDFKKHLLDLEDFNLKMTLYESELKEYDGWLNSIETIKLKKSLNKAEAEVERLKKKLKIK